MKKTFIKTGTKFFNKLVNNDFRESWMLNANERYCGSINRSLQSQSTDTILEMSKGRRLLKISVPVNKIVEKEFFGFKVSFLEESVNVGAKFSDISFIKVWAIITYSNEQLFNSK
mgnify:CR=1 FL=1